MHAAASDRNTSAGTVVPYYVAASLTFFIAAIVTVFSVDAFFGHYFQPRLLAITHLLTIGWGTMMIFGALSQFLPVLLEVRLYSEKLSKLAFFLLLPGITGLSISFWIFETGWPMQLSSVIVTSSVFLVAFNVYKTASSAKAWTIAADLISTSVGWLLITAIAGTLLIFNFRYMFLPQSHLTYLKVHAHLGIVGWFLLLIIGVSSRLIPMFLLSSKTNQKLLSWTYYLVNSGLIAFIVGVLIFNDFHLIPLYIFIISSGILVHLFFLRECYKSRVRKVLDVGMRQSLVAFLLLVLPVILIIIVSVIQRNGNAFISFYVAYGFTIFFGFISTLILGQTYKTLPFIVWMKSNKQKTDSTLLPRDVYSEKVAKIQFLFHASGVLLAVPGLLFDHKLLFLIGSVCVLLSALFFHVNLFKILRHLFLKR